MQKQSKATESGKLVRTKIIMAVVSSSVVLILGLSTNVGWVRFLGVFWATILAVQR